MFKFGERLESVIAKPTALQWGFCGVILGFVLCMLSSLAGLGSVRIAVDGATKEVGFWSALNWSGTFLILYPIFLIILGFQLNHVHGWIKNLAQERQVVTKANEPLSRVQLSSLWRRHLNSGSVVFLLLAICCLMQALTDWWKSTGKLHYVFLSSGDLRVGSEPRDWSIAKLLNHGLAPAERLSNIGEPSWGDFAFSFFAYLYMGLTLFLYLSALVHTSIFAWFVCSLSAQHGNESNQLRYQPNHLIGRARLFLHQAFWMAFLGFAVMLLMRIQVEYIASGAKYRSLNDLLFSNWDAIYGWALSNGDPLAVAAPTSNYDDDTSNFTALSSIAIGCFAMVALVFVFYSIVSAVLALEGKSKPGSTATTSHSVSSAISMLIPEWRRMTAIVLLVWLSALLPQLGALFVATCVATIVVGGQKMIPLLSDLFRSRKKDDA